MPTWTDITALGHAGGGLANAYRDRYGETEDAVFRGSDLGDDLARGSARTNAAFDSLSGSLARRQSALGLQLSDRQRQSQARQMGLARAIALADTSGTIRRGDEERRDITGRAAVEMESNLEGIRLGGLSSLANMEGQQNIREAERKAQRRAARNGLIGNVVGTAATLLLSSRSVKDRKGKVSVLDKLATLPIERWAYKGDEADHIGTYAEDFNDTFGVNQDRRGVIDLVDAVGVLMGSVQELNTKFEAMNAV